jgi:tripartite-type tricarboxylate transporter receptor subunit TctC
MKAARLSTPLALVFALVGVLCTSAASSQEFPTRLIKIIVPYPAGGGVDGLARPIAERLSRLWGQSVIIENKPGASTMIGGAEVARATPDGHTLFFTSDSSITSNPHLFKKMLYDPIKELAPVTQLIDLHQFVLVHPSVGANTMKELVALAKSKPNALNYGSYGKGSQPHLLFEMLRKETGAQIQQIAYRGIAPAITAAISGEVQMTLGSVAVAAGHIESKKLKALAIGRETRMPLHPEIPTLKEAGFPDIEPRSWFGLFAPAGTPPSVIGKIQKDVAAVLKEPEFEARFIERAGHTAVASAPAAFASFIQDDLKAKGNMIATAGITAE